MNASYTPGKDFEGVLADASSEQVQCWNHHIRLQDHQEHQVLTLEVVLNEPDLDAIEKAIGVIVQRHESLRTCFIWMDGAVRQCIAPYYRELYLPAVYDVSNETAPKEVVEQRIREQRKLLRNLDQVPLVRSCLFKLSPKEYGFYLQVHHLIFDEWSKINLLKELREFYGRFQNGGQVAAVPAVMQVRDYVRWQQERFAAQGMATRSHWKQRLSALEVTPFDLDRRIQALDALSGSTYTFLIGGSFYENLGTLARSCRASMLAVLTAGLRLLFRKACDEEKALLYLPMVTRGISGAELIIGYLTGGIYLYASLHEEMTIRSLIMDSYLEILKSSQYVIHDHRLYGLDEPVLRAKMRLFLNFVGKAMIGDEKLPGLPPDGPWGSAPAPYFSLTYSISEYTDGMYCIWRFIPTLYSRETILELIGAHLRLLELMYLHPETTAGELLRRY